MDAAIERWPIGCATRPWLQEWGGEVLAVRLPDVMCALAEIGFAGFETRLSCLPLHDPAGFGAMRAAAGGIALAGAHVVGTFWEPDSGAAIPAIATDAAGLPALGCDRVVLSVVPLPAPLAETDLDRLATNLDALGRAPRHRCPPRLPQPRGGDRGRRPGARRPRCGVRAGGVDARRGPRLGGARGDAGRGVHRALRRAAGLCACAGRDGGQRGRLH